MRQRWIRKILVAARCPRVAEDAGVAMLTVIMFMLVVASLSVLVLGAVISQVRPTSAAQTNGRTEYAAQSGIQAAVQAMRTARGTANGFGTSYGDLTKLPCPSIAGTVGDPAGKLSYSVTITYYDAAGAAISCRNNGGLSTLPGYALIDSRGTQAGTTAGASSRRLRSKYTFATTNASTVGDYFWTYPKVAGASPEFCLAGSPGGPVTYQKQASCNHWAMTSDSTIMLVDGSGASNHFCLTAPAGGGVVTLMPCHAGNSPGIQQWTYAGYFRYQSATSSTGSNFCLWANKRETPAPGDALWATAAGCVVYGSGPSGEDTLLSKDYWSWAPGEMLGAGSAGAAHGQFVNGEDFGRCLEVTRNDVTSTKEGIGPCQQTIPGSNTWNQSWTYTGTSAQPGFLYVVNTNPYDDYYDPALPHWCLDAVGPSTEYPAMRPCTDGAESQQFTVVGNTGDYPNSYLIKDVYGRCLGKGPQYPVGDPSSPDGEDSMTLSSVQAQTCDITGGPLAAGQKWNAPANVGSAGLGDTYEAYGAS